MFGLLPRVLFWLALILGTVAAIFPPPAALPAQLDDSQWLAAGFVALSLLAVWAYPFTRLLRLLLVLVLFAGVIELIRTIPATARDTDAFFVWGLESAAVAMSMVIVTVLRKFVPPRLALAPPGPEKHVWKRLAVLPALLVGIFLAGTALADRTGRVEASFAEMLPASIVDFATASVDRSYVQRFVLPEATPVSAVAGSGASDSASESLLSPAEETGTGMVTAPDAVDGSPGSTQIGMGRGGTLPVAANDGALLSVDFDLGRRVGSSDAIEIRKRVSVAGTPVGNLRLRIDANSQLYADIGQIQALLPDTGQPLPVASDGFVSFQDLRKAGIAIRYDVGKDQIVLAGP